jgi:hypothetical protein
MKKKEEAMPEISAPFGFQKGFHIEQDVDKGVLKGVPKAWRYALPNALVADDKNVNNFLIPQEAPSPPSQDTSSPTAFAISRPFGFKHNVHVCWKMEQKITECLGRL